MEYLPSATDLSEALAFALGGFFLLFFIISPIAGRILAYGIESKWAFTVITSTLVLTFIITAFGLNMFLLPKLLPELGADRMAIMSTALGVGVSAIITYYVRWMIMPLGISPYQKELDELDFDTPLDERRRNFMEKRYRMTGRKNT